MPEISTINFLIDLSFNNNKSWFDANRPAYEAARADFLRFTEELIEEISAFDPTIHDLQAKDCMFRINRDIRFSSDKSPYKSYFGASIKAGGRKQEGVAGYYFHLEPGQSFAGGGLFNPSPEKLRSIRKKLSSDFGTFSKQVLSPAFISQFGDLSRDEYFTLKRVPKGFDQQDEAAEYLKLKSYIASVKIDDDLLISAELKSFVCTAFRTIYPLNAYLNQH